MLKKNNNKNCLGLKQLSLLLIILLTFGCPSILPQTLNPTSLNEGEVSVKVGERGLIISSFNTDKKNVLEEDILTLRTFLTNKNSDPVNQILVKLNSDGLLINSNDLIQEVEQIEPNGTEVLTYDVTVPSLNLNKAFNPTVNVCYNTKTISTRNLKIIDTDVYDSNKKVTIDTGSSYSSINAVIDFSNTKQLRISKPFQNNDEGVYKYRALFLKLSNNDEGYVVNNFNNPGIKGINNELGISSVIVKILNIGNALIRVDNTDPSNDFICINDVSSRTGFSNGCWASDGISCDSSCDLTPTTNYYSSLLKNNCFQNSKIDYAKFFDKTNDLKCPSGFTLNNVQNSENTCSIELNSEKIELSSWLIIELEKTLNYQDPELYFDFGKHINLESCENPMIFTSLDSNSWTYEGVLFKKVEDKFRVDVSNSSKYILISSKAGSCLNENNPKINLVTQKVTNYIILPGIIKDSSRVKNPSTILGNSLIDNQLNNNVYLKQNCSLDGSGNCFKSSESNQGYLTNCYSSNSCDKSLETCFTDSFAKSEGELVEFFENGEKCSWINVKSYENILTTNSSAICFNKQKINFINRGTSSTLKIPTTFNILKGTEQYVDFVSEVNYRYCLNEKELVLSAEKQI